MAEDDGGLQSESEHCVVGYFWGDDGKFLTKEEYDRKLDEFRHEQERMRWAELSWWRRWVYWWARQRA